MPSPSSSPPPPPKKAKNRKKKTSCIAPAIILIGLFFINPQQVNSTDSKEQEIDKDRDNPLIQASINGHLETVKYLCQNGANVNEKDDYGYTPLICASKNGHLEIVKYLCREWCQYQ